MLSRTADNLYWLARYMERADYLARVVEVTRRMANLPRAYGGVATEWDSALISSGAEEAFAATGLEPNETNVTCFLTFDENNPSSIRNCIELARTNARAVRTALTHEMWEAINGGWLEIRRFDARRNAQGMLDAEDLTQFLELVKEVSVQFDGSAYRTMLRNDAYWFSRLGLYIERADNTARILDVKYHVLLPDVETVGGSLDYFQWTSVLRAVSALTAYHWVYRQSIKPWLIADLLILKAEMPRSLLSCYENISHYLDLIGKAYGRQGLAQRQSRQLYARLEHARIDEIFQTGLHEFITTFIDDNNRIGGRIAEQYLV
jgi:uncharacterized alpha-E superfamily protein